MVAETTVCNVCGMENPAYEPVTGGCGGLGVIECLCGGDLCVCHNHGEVPCEGCPDCERGDDWPDLDEEEPHPPGSK